MLDHFIHGKVNRISPEAPVPIVEVHDEIDMLGGCGNVIINLYNLGVSVKVLSVIGDDKNGRTILNKLNDIKIKTGDISRSNHFLTNYKMRIIANNQHVVRADWNSSSLNQETEDFIYNSIDKLINNVDGVIVSDYLKGVCTEKIIKKIITSLNNNNKPIFVDPKGSNWDKYSGATFITPNIEEISSVIGGILQSDDDFLVAGRNILKKYQINNCLITRGANGMTFVNKDVSFHIPAKSKEVYDVSGAGDTVIATLATGIINGRSINEAVELSNLAASIVVSHLGTSAITLDELQIK